MFYELGLNFLNQWSKSASQRFTSGLRKVLLSSYINNILGTITAASSFTLICLTVLELSDYPISSTFAMPLIITSLCLIFLSIALVLLLTKEIKVEKMLGLNKTTPAIDVQNMLLPILKSYLDQNQKTDSQAQIKIEKLEQALRVTTQVIQELEEKVEHLEQSHTTPQRSYQDLH